MTLLPLRFISVGLYILRSQQGPQSLLLFAAFPAETPGLSLINEHQNTCFQDNKTSFSQPVRIFKFITRYNSYFLIAVAF